MGFMKPYLQPSGNHSKKSYAAPLTSQPTSATTTETSSHPSSSISSPATSRNTSAEQKQRGLAPGSGPNAQYGGLATRSRESSLHGNSRPPSQASSPARARPRSTYPDGDSRTSSTAELVNLKTDVMCNWLHQQQVEKMWSSGGHEEGVMLKKTRDDYLCCPRDLQADRDGFFDVVKKLNVRCAMTVNTRLVKLFLGRGDIGYVPLENGLRLQVLTSIKYLPQCQKHHFAAFIQDRAILIVWDDDPNHILERVKSIEDQLIRMIWKEEDPEEEKSSAAPNGKLVSWAPSLHINEFGTDRGVFDEKLAPPARRIVLVQPIITAITLVLLIAAISGGWRKVAIEMAYDRSWIRLAFAVVVPLQCWLGLFFFQSIATSTAQIIGPISQMNANTKFFSGQAPPRLYSSTMPHVTIQCPVYKEGLWSVIDPTVKSIKAAISTYEMQGGSANIFINDDGMQLITPTEAQERRDYYDEHNIGWVARPKHNPKPPVAGDAPFIRAGKFKKASNMNYALNVSARIEDKLATITGPVDWTQDLENEHYRAALAEVVEEDDGRTWADGNIRLGDYILLIDSDTRVPTDCFLDAVSEMELSPEVAIIQFSSGVMNVTDSWFEKGITFFTNLVYTAIQYAVSNGDVAPFVGHNAFLRWSAVQDVASVAPAAPQHHHHGPTEQLLYWSESTVSEDFDMALRLQTAGYILRLAAYAGQGFKEGVSLTVYDELARWEKYAYGCSELIFHPFAQWPHKGPFTPLFRAFVSARAIPLPSKLTIMAYIGTYYAIGSAWVLTLLNYCLVGWFNGQLDHYYIDSFKIYFAIILIFTALGNVALAVLRYRTEQQEPEQEQPQPQAQSEQKQKQNQPQRGLLASLRENLTWVPLLIVFLGGISLHVSQAIVCHLCGIDMSWGATSKEATRTSFFAEVPQILRRFRFTFAWCGGVVAGMLVLGGVGPVGALVPYDWRIRVFTAVYPLATVVGSHFLLPLVLNPGLMQFTF